MTNDPVLPDDLFPDDRPLPDDAARGAPLPDAWLAAAREYHRPPDVAPVAAIEAAVAARLASAPEARSAAAPGASRATGAAAHLGAGEGSHPSPTPRPVHRRPAVRGVLALAATLLVGVLIGRATLGPGPRGSSRSGGATVATADAPFPDRAEPSATAEAATQLHLARTEALLTAVRAATTRGQAPADLGPWARDLLTSTRLFLDSPVARDPAEQALLAELELLLMAVVQASASRRAADTELLAQQLRRSQLLPRLRAVASPAADAVSPPISD